jgi:bifunctional DNA primase/polymerase-like protein
MVEDIFTPLERAYMFSQVGWRVLPVSLRNGRKSAALKDWPNKASCDWTGVVQDWFINSHSRCDVGIMTGVESGMWVLDIDVHWCNGFASARDLFAEHGETKKPDTFRVKTPSGGEQLYFRYSADYPKITNVSSTPGSPGPLGPGLDVRGWHGMVVAPGAAGRQVITEHVNLLDLPEAPSWLVNLVTKQKARRASQAAPITSGAHALRLAQRVADRLSRVGPGARNQALNNAAYELGVAVGSRNLLSEQDARSLLLDACKENGAWDDDGPKGLGQCIATFESGWTSGLRDGAQDVG